MRVKTITCSGANENTSVSGLLDLLSEFPKAEARNPDFGQISAATECPDISG